jgi:hypothetical protein
MTAARVNHNAAALECGLYNAMTDINNRSTFLLGLRYL